MDRLGCHVVASDWPAHVAQSMGERGVYGGPERDAWQHPICGLRGTVHGGVWLGAWTGRGTRGSPWLAGSCGAVYGGARLSQWTGAGHMAAPGWLAQVRAVHAAH